MAKPLVFDTDQSTTPYDERPIREVWKNRKKELEKKDMLTENFKIGDKVVIDMDKPFHSDGKTYPVEAVVKDVGDFEYKYAAILEAPDGRRFLATKPVKAGPTYEDAVVKQRPPVDQPHEKVSMQCHWCGKPIRKGDTYVQDEAYDSFCSEECANASWGKETPRRESSAHTAKKPRCPKCGKKMKKCECEETPNFLACSECSAPLHTGDRVLDDGEHVFCSKKCAGVSDDDPIGHQEGYDFPEEPNEPEESDLVTQDNETYYQDGKEVLAREKGGDRSVWYYRTSRGQWMDLGKFGDDDDAAVKAYMERTQFFPNVWFQSDHGNWVLRSASERKAELMPANAGKGVVQMVPGDIADCSSCGSVWEFDPKYPEDSVVYWDNTGRSFCDATCAREFLNGVRKNAPKGKSPSEEGPGLFSGVKEDPEFDPDVSIPRIQTGSKKGGRRGR